MHTKLRLGLGLRLGFLLFAGLGLGLEIGMRVVVWGKGELSLGKTKT